MKKTWYIARNELYSLFYSPIAWVMMILFLVLTSAGYIGITDVFLSWFHIGGAYLQKTQNLTANQAIGSFGFLKEVINNLYIFLPLITMGLISREISSGTIKILHSSPVRIRQIVLGKYLAMLVFTFCLMLLLTLTLISMSISVVNTDYGHLLASMIGLFLVLSTYVAIGLFISALTSYQLVAAIITFALLMTLQRIGYFWQEIELVRDITYYLDIGGKTRNLMEGLFNLRDFCYCVIITGSFLLFTMIRIKSSMQSIPSYKKATRYIAVISVASLLGYITSKPALNVYADFSRDQLFTISRATRNTLAKLNDGELKITAYVNLLNSKAGGYGLMQPGDQKSLVTEIWERYIRFKPDISIEFVYFYNTDSSSDYYFKINPGKTLKEIAQNEAESYRVDLDFFLSPEQVKERVDVTREENRNFFELSYKGKKSIARIFDDDQIFPSENEIAAAIKRLIMPPPKILFLTNEIERGPFSFKPRDYRLVTGELGNRFSLLNQGYDFDTLSLKNVSVIPLDIAALVIADPRTAFSADNLQKINQYIDAGGNLYLSGEPDRIDVTKPLFEKFGITLRPGMIMEPKPQYSSDVVHVQMTDTANNLSPRLAKRVRDHLKYNNEDVAIVGMAGASVMDYQAKDGFNIYPLLITNKKLAWNRIDPVNEDSLQLKVSRMPSDETGTFTTAVRLNRNINGKEQRVIIASDADYLTQAQFFGPTAPIRFNYLFGFWCFSYFSYGNFPENTIRPESIDNSFRIYTVDTVPTLKLIFYWAIPAIIAIIGSVILIRRKRK